MKLSAPLWIWSSDKGSWHFITVPAEQAGEFRAEAMSHRASFGSVRVQARIGDVQWRTSLFPDRKSGGYLLPIKAEVRRRAVIAASDVVEVELLPFPGEWDAV